MFNQVKQITFFTLILFMAFSLSAQEIDTLTYSEADSIQDVRLKQMEQQLKAVNYKLLKINRAQQEERDSIELINRQQSEEIRILAGRSEHLKKQLQLAEVQIEVNDVKLRESRTKFKRSLFVSIPVLFIIFVLMAVFLFLLIQKNKSRTEIQLNALRKYTYDELEDVKAGYVDEIKRRVKKIAAKLKPFPRKKSSKKQKR